MPNAQCLAYIAYIAYILSDFSVESSYQRPMPSVWPILDLIPALLIRRQDPIIAWQ